MPIARIQRGADGAPAPARSRPRSMRARWQMPAVADSPERPDQPDVTHGVGELRPPAGLEVRQQDQPSLVIGAMAPPAQRHHAQPIGAPTQRTRDQMRRVDPPIGPTHDAGTPGDRSPLGLRRHQCRAGKQRLAASQGLVGARARRRRSEVRFITAPISWVLAEPRGALAAPPHSLRLCPARTRATRS